MVDGNIFTPAEFIIVDPSIHYMNPEYTLWVRVDQLGCAWSFATFSSNTLTEVRD